MFKKNELNFSYFFFKASKYKIHLVDLSVAFVIPRKTLPILITSIFLKLNMINHTVIYLPLELRDVDIFGRGLK